MAEVVWTPGALNDIEAIASYIALDSAFHAGRQVLRILSTEDLLVCYPRSGRFVQEIKNKSFREVLIPPYRVIYHLDVKKDQVGVLAVVHSKQKLRPTAIRRRLSQ